MMERTKGRDIVAHVSVGASGKDTFGHGTDHNSQYRPRADK